MVIILTGVSKSSGLEYDVVKCTLAFHQFLDGSDACIFDTAAQTSICQFKKFLRTLCQWVFARGNIDCLG